MFATPHLSTKDKTVKEFSLIEDSIKSVYLHSDYSNDNSNAVNKVIVGESDVTTIKKANKNVNETFRQYVKASELCLDIEKNLSNALCQLDGQVLDSASPVVLIKKRLPVYDENGNRRRIRRKPEELVGEKNHVCPYHNCEKTYTSKCSLYLHIKRNHAEDEDVKAGETAPVRTNSKVKKGVNIYKVFKQYQAEKYECRVSQESTKNYSDKEKSSFSECSSRKLTKCSPSGSAKTSLDISESSIDSALKRYFDQKNAQCEVEETNEIYAKEEIFSHEEKESRKTLFSMTDDEIYNKFENMSDDLDSVLCLPYDNEGIYENFSVEKELIYDSHENQGEEETNDVLSGLIFNAEQTHLNKREFEFLDFEEQKEQDLNELMIFDSEIVRVEAPFTLLF